ncbi:type II toxin-antitoxin system death-on-curing family toxin [bacterium]|nr:type II toxin-antitoxin system death-on-curing family toxin [bacterium]
MDVSSPRFLTLQEVLHVHDVLVDRYGGRPGLIEPGLLESAVAAPQAGSASGEYYCPDIFAMAARYLTGIARNHSFEDGNKRTAAASTVLFLRLNGVTLLLSQDELYQLTQDAVAGTADAARVHALLKARSVDRS